MDYHDLLLAEAETCVQTAVESDAIVFVRDVAAFALCPLVGYQKFISAMCARIGEAQDLLPYNHGRGVIALDDANLEITLPDGLIERAFARIKRLND